jgi:hypothetical protein
MPHFSSERQKTATSQTRQLLEDVQLSPRNAISGEGILTSYADETRQQFAVVIKQIIEGTHPCKSSYAFTTAHRRLDEGDAGQLYSRRPEVIGVGANAIGLW